MTASDAGLDELGRPALTHREFKILLEAKTFGSHRSVAEMASRVAALADRFEVPFDAEPAIKSHVRTVQFFDTPELHLKQNWRLLRMRSSHIAVWPDDPVEVCFKFRVWDRDQLLELPIYPTLDVHVQFKEEIVVGSAAGSRRSIWSYNSVTKTDPTIFSRFDGASLKQMLHLSVVKIPEDATMQPVGQFDVFEISSKLGTLHFGPATVAHCDLVVWRIGLTSEPFIAEIGFTYHVLPDAPAQAYALSEEFFDALADECAEMRSHADTKTQLLYRMAREGRK